MRGAVASATTGTNRHLSAPATTSTTTTISTVAGDHVAAVNNNTSFSSNSSNNKHLFFLICNSNNWYWKIHGRGELEGNSTTYLSRKMAILLGNYD